MNVPEKKRRSRPACMHQCTKCGLMYECGQPRCGRPFYSGVCPRTETLAREGRAMFALP